MEYEVIRSDRKSFAAQIKGDGLIIRAPLRATDREIAAFVERHRELIEKHLAEAKKAQSETAATRVLTREEIEELANKALVYIPMRTAELARLVGVKYKGITIRNQRTRWGSCSSAGNLNFNCLLMLTPPEIIDSVIVHELCHRKQMNHSEKFYDEVLRVCPNYWACHEWLREHERELFALLGA